MVGGEMAPNDLDVPRADYFNEVCPKEERYIINGNDLKKDLPWVPPAKICDRRAVHRDTERNGADIVRLLYHPPRMISTAGHADYSDQIMPSIYGPNYADLAYSQNSSGPPSSTHQQAVL
jgi:hypothetical protein